MLSSKIFNNLSSLTELSGSPPGEYSQDIPVKAPGEKSSGPPILPPHLLQVILNKDTSLQVGAHSQKYNLQQNV